MKTTSIVFILTFISYLSKVHGQTFITKEEAIQLTIDNHPQIKVSNLQVAQQTILRKQSLNVANPELLWQAPTAGFYTPGVLLAIDNPAVYVLQGKAQNTIISITEAERKISRNELLYGTVSVYNDLQYLIEKNTLLKKQDSLYFALIDINDTRYKLGAISQLDRINGESRYKTIHYQLLQNKAQLRETKMRFALQLGFPNDTSYLPNEKLKKAGDTKPIYDSTSYKENPSHSLFLKQIELNKRQLTLAKARMYPGILAGYLNQGNRDSPINYRFQFGITLPIFYWTYTSRIKAARKGIDIARGQYLLNNFRITGEYAQALADYREYTESLNYFEETGLLQSAEVLRSAGESYRAGKIGYITYLQSIEQAFTIEMEHIVAIKGFNQVLLTLKYLQGKME